MSLHRSEQNGLNLFSVCQVPGFLQRGQPMSGLLMGMSRSAIGNVKGQVVIVLNRAFVYIRNKKSNT